MDGGTSGTVGQAKRWEGIHINLNNPVSGNTDTPFRQITQVERVQMAKNGYKGVVN